jgi:hypothetical protein
MSKTLVQEQFGKNAAGYLTSTPHALGKSLERLVALTAPQKSWRALDIATGGGLTTLVFYLSRHGYDDDANGFR